MRFNPEKMRPLGEGGEKKVYISPEDEDKVVAIFKEGVKSKETVASMKGRFYLTKILHLLIPNSIPDVHLAARSEDKAILVSERKYLDDKHLELNRLYQLYLQGELPPDKFKEFDKALEDHNNNLNEDDLRSLGKKINELGVMVDPMSINLGVDTNDNLVYVDNTFRPWRYSKAETPYGENGISKFYNPEKIRGAATDLPEQDRDKVLQYLDRLEALYDEENGAG